MKIILQLKPSFSIDGGLWVDLIFFQFFLSVRTGCGMTLKAFEYPSTKVLKDWNSDRPSIEKDLDIFRAIEFSWCYLLYCIVNFSK